MLVSTCLGDLLAASKSKSDNNENMETQRKMIIYIMTMITMIITITRRIITILIIRLIIRTMRIQIVIMISRCTDGAGRVRPDVSKLLSS